MSKKKTWIIILVVIIIASITIAVAMNMIKENKNRPYNYDLDKYVELGNYKDLPYAREEVKVKAAEVDEEIEKRLSQASEVKNVKEGTVKDGDTVNIAFKGTVDGKAFEGGSSESFDLTVGTTQMIDGFVEGLMGKKIGDHVKLDLRFPDDYQNKDLAGKPVVFDVTINSKKEVKKPKLDEDFVKKNSEVETVKEYKKTVKEELIKRKEQRIDDQIKGRMWAQIIESSKAKKFPEKEMGEAETKVFYIENQYRQQAQAAGMEWDQYLKEYMGTDEEGFKKFKKDYAENLVLQDMVMHSIARKEGIRLNKREYKKELDRILTESGYTREKFQKDYGKTIEQMAEEQDWESNIFLNKVMDRVIELGKKVSQEEYEKIIKDQDKAQSQEEQ